MKVVIHVVLIVALVLQGCSTTHVITRESTADDYRRMNEVTMDNECVVLLRAGGEEKITGLTVDSRIIRFQDRESKHRRQIPTLNVRQIIVRDRSRGGRIGLAVGLLVGGVVFGYLGGSLSCGMDDVPGCDSEAFIGGAIPGGLLGGLLCGLVLGLPIGYASGAKENYVFKHDTAEER
jgi:hypothetical protein